MGNILSFCVPWSNLHPTPSASSEPRSNVVLESTGTTSNIGSIFNHPMTEIKSAYALGKRLGEGSFGTVRLAINKKTCKQFACKSIKNVRSGRWRHEKIRREVEIMHHLSGHPNIVNIHEVFEESNDVHIVMELCEGQELYVDRTSNQARYTEDMVRNVFRQIMEVIRYCHSMGVMHRDLKMENLMFSTEENSHLKAIDFGAGTFFKPGEKFEECVGTRRYVDTQVLQRRPYGPEVDIWSAGVILRHLLSGYFPNDAEIRKGEYLDFKGECWGSISSEAKNLVKGMLQADPATRLSTDEIMNDKWFVGQDGYEADGALHVTIVGKMKQFHAMNKFKRVALKVIAEGLLLEETAGLRNIFQSIAGNDNKITFEALKVGLNKWGGKISDTEAKKLMDSVDLDGNGTIDRTEFISATMNSTMMAREGRLREAFQIFAEGRFKHFMHLSNIFITRKELKQALDKDCMAGKNLPCIFCLPIRMYTRNKQVEEIFAEVDTKKDGRIDYDEFEGMMMGNN